jgi:hypothetical protein
MWKYLFDVEYINNGTWEPLRFGNMITSNILSRKIYIFGIHPSSRIPSLTTYGNSSLVLFYGKPKKKETDAFSKMNPLKNLNSRTRSILILWKPFTLKYG